MALPGRDGPTTRWQMCCSHGLRALFGLMLLLASVLLHSGIQIMVQMWHKVSGASPSSSSPSSSPSSSANATIPSNANANAHAHAHANTNTTAATNVRGGDYNFSFVMVTLLSELLKMCVSVGFFVAVRVKGAPRIGWRTSLKFAVPALLYAAANNLTYVILGLSTSPVMYQVFGCVEVVMIAALSRIIIGRKMNKVQWSAIVVLCTSVAGCQLAKQGGAADLDAFPMDVFALTMVSCFFSSSGGVSTEFLLQHDKKQFGFFEQSSHLYGWGVVVNFVGVLVKDRHNLAAVFQLRGLGGWPIAIILMYTRLGIVTGGILKYLDSIWRTIAQIISLFLTVILSAIIFSDHAGIGFWLALFNVAVAIFLYRTAGDTPPPTGAGGTGGARGGVGGPGSPGNGRDRRGVGVSINGGGGGKGRRQQQRATPVKTVDWVGRLGGASGAGQIPGAGIPGCIPGGRRTMDGDGGRLEEGDISPAEEDYLLSASI